MYICLDCGNVFDKCEYETDEMGQKWQLCPVCKGESIDEAVHCKKCHEATGREQARYGLCADCETDAERRFINMLSKFTKEEIEYLNNQYDGRYFE